MRRAAAPKLQYKAYKEALNMPDDERTPGADVVIVSAAIVVLVCLAHWTMEGPVTDYIKHNLEQNQ